jgi:hypothetical protein
VSQLHSTGRGGSGNFKTGPGETSTERDRRLSTAPKLPDGNYSFGRGGVGNIEAARALQKKTDDGKTRHDALIPGKAKAETKTPAEATQTPKPSKST